MYFKVFLTPSNVTEKILAHMACLDGRRPEISNKWKRQSKWHRKRFLKSRDSLKDNEGNTA